MSYDFEKVAKEKKEAETRRRQEREKANEQVKRAYRLNSTTNNKRLNKELKKNETFADKVQALLRRVEQVDKHMKEVMSREEIKNESDAGKSPSKPTT